MPSTVPEPRPVRPGGPRACHRLAPQKRTKIIKRLVGTSMVVFVPKAEHIRDTLSS